MPTVGYGYQQPGLVDLASLAMQQKQLKQQKQQQQIANLMAIAQAIQQAQQQKQQMAQQQQSQTFEQQNFDWLKQQQGQELDINRMKQQQDLAQLAYNMQKDKTGQQIDLAKEWLFQSNVPQERLDLYRQKSQEYGKPFPYMNIGGEYYKQNKDAAVAESNKLIEYDPVSGEARVVSDIPKGASVRNKAKTLDRISEEAKVRGEAGILTKDSETAQKLSSAVKRLSIINKQYAKALPSGDKTPLEQRISGGMNMWAVRAGLINNPELLALRKNIRPMAINLIRLFGEVGNLSESEQKGAIDVVNQAGLTDKERIAQTKQFIEFALAGASPGAMNWIKTNRKDISGILDAFGVEVGDMGTSQNNPYKSKYGLE